MADVLISIQPKWVEKIANGEKTIEVRKSRPKLHTPFKVYIYATKPKKNFDFGLCRDKWGMGVTNKINYETAKRMGFELLSGKVIGEFVCDRIEEYGAEFTELQYPDACDKNVSLNSIKRVEFDEEADEPFYRYETSNEEYNPDDCKFLKESCLTFNEVRQYIGETCYDKHFYGWHISQLKIYDKPKELSEFYSIAESGSDCCTGCIYHETPLEEMPCRNCTGKRKYLYRAPQSWCYVEEQQNR